MNCHSPLPFDEEDAQPFAADDPFLPAQDAPFGECPICGDEHRLDLGCAVADQSFASWPLLFGAGALLVVLAAAGIWCLWRWLA